ncbi:MAG: hypothetical protein H7Z40_20325, partial [Phycisphaerae bacterium]|nr:hypothetical protein [Gemmatimonadaceae bacterium]
AAFKTADGAVVAAPEIQWSSSAPAVATVVDNGSATTVTAVNDGVAAITARSGGLSATTQSEVRRALSSITLTKPVRVMEYGTTAQFSATAFDARHNAIPNVQGFTFLSDDPSIAFVQPNGAVTALFKFPQLHDAVITASLSRDGTTATAKVPVVLGEPLETDYGALLLTNFVEPNQPNAFGSGIALINRLADRIAYRVVWSGLTSPVTSVAIRGPIASAGTGDLLVDLLPLPTLDASG